jgi:glutaconate CoA-transferase subunit A
MAASLRPPGLNYASDRPEGSLREKRLSLEEAAERIPSGASIAIGGTLIRRQPLALLRALIRLGRRDLTVYGFALGPAIDLLAAAGAARRYEGVYGGMFRYGLAHNFRRAVERGALEVRDWSESSITARFRAAAMGVPYLPTRVLFGTGMAAHNPEQVREITCPFTGQRLHAIPAIEAGFTLLHGYVADVYGNVQWPVHHDPDDIDFEMAKAANRLIVTVERIVPHAVIARRPTLTYIPHAAVEAVVEVPFGAHPGPCDGFYDEDEEHLRLYQTLARDPERFPGYLETYVYGADHARYLELVGGPAHLDHLRVPEEVV